MGTREMRGRTRSNYRWLPLPFLIPIAFFVGSLAGAIVAGTFRAWDLPTIGFCAAIAVVFTGHHTAPTHRFGVSVVLLLIGGVAAYLLVGRSCYPEGYEKAYEPTYIPLLTTLFGGLLGVTYSFLRTRGEKEIGLERGSDTFNSPG